jgi:hypothetical protein
MIQNILYEKRIIGQNLIRIKNNGELFVHIFVCYKAITIKVWNDKRSRLKNSRNWEGTLRKGYEINE